MLQIISDFLVAGVIWFVADIFLIPGLMRARQDEVRRRLTLDVLANENAPGAQAPRA